MVRRVRRRSRRSPGGVLAGIASRSLAFCLLWLVPGALMDLSTRAYLGYAGRVLFVAFARTARPGPIAQDGLTLGAGRSSPGSASGWRS